MVLHCLNVVKAITFGFLEAENKDGRTKSSPSWKADTTLGSKEDLERKRLLHPCQEPGMACLHESHQLRNLSERRAGHQEGNLAGKLMQGNCHDGFKEWFLWGREPD